MLRDLYRVLMPDGSVHGDPDPTYKLTLDNMTKIVAINMRFR